MGKGGAKRFFQFVVDVGILRKALCHYADVVRCLRACEQEPSHMKGLLQVVLLEALVKVSSTCGCVHEHLHEHLEDMLPQDGAHKAVRTILSGFLDVF